MGQSADMCMGDWTMRKDERTGLFWTGQTLFVLDDGAEPIEEPEEIEVEAEVDGQPKEAKAVAKKSRRAVDPTLKRRRDRTRQLQRGFGREDKDEEQLTLLRCSLDMVEKEGGGDWHRGRGWISSRLCSRSGRCLKAQVLRWLWC